MNAGIDARAHFTMSVTIDMNGIFTSVMTILFSIFMKAPLVLRLPEIQKFPGTGRPARAADHAFSLFGGGISVILTAIPDPMGAYIGCYRLIKQLFLYTFNQDVTGQAK